MSNHSRFLSAAGIGEEKLPAILRDAIRESEDVYLHAS